MIIESYFGIERDAAQQMIAATKNMANDKSGDNAFQSTKVFLFDEYAVLKMQNITLRKVSMLYRFLLSKVKTGTDTLFNKEQRARSCMIETR